MSCAILLLLLVSLILAVLLDIIYMKEYALSVLLDALPVIVGAIALHATRSSFYILMRLIIIVIV